mmetsp:Transcript_25821/g.65399  ORF Transcript_25821/g.65399 Transcript_25821/m.65399 type:complete len:205 (-) Transcript_25821:1121-1735(-)
MPRSPLPIPPLAAGASAAPLRLSLRLSLSLSARARAHAADCGRCGAHAQLRLHSMARAHLARWPARAASSMAGAKVASVAAEEPSSSGPDHTPAPMPAATAAPAAVVSTSAGRSTSTPRRSAWYCSSGSDMLTPPSTRSAASFTPLLAPSAAIASATSLAWKAIPSSTARATCALVWRSVRPTSEARASSRQCGARRPLKAGTK